MSVKIGVLSDPQEFIQDILEQIGLRGGYEFVQDEFGKFPIMIPDGAILNPDKQAMLENYLEQGGRILLFVSSEGKLPWGIRAIKIAEQGDAITLKAVARDIAGEPGWRLPLWRVPAMALEKGAGTPKTTEIASFYQRSAPAVLSLEHSGGCALVCGFPLFESLRRCASSTWPFGYGALASMLKAMVNWICQDLAELPFKSGQPVAVFSFDMEAPIVNRAMGKIRFRLPVPWSGESVFITSHHLKRWLPLRRRMLISRSVAHYAGIPVALLRIYVDWHLRNKKRLFDLRSILMLQCERSTGKHLVLTSLPQFKQDLLHISEIFVHYGWRCTFFIPGEIVETIADDSLFQDLQSAGFEFALHSYHHDHYGNMTTEEISRDIQCSIEAFKRKGITPLGSRCPGGFMHKGLLPELQKAGLLYDSSILEPYGNYPILPVKAPSSPLPFYQVPVSGNFYRDDQDLAKKINHVAKQGGLLHLYGHDHEFHRLDSDGARLKELLNTLQQQGFKIMTVRELLGDS